MLGEGVVKLVVVVIALMASWVLAAEPGGKGISVMTLNMAVGGEALGHGPERFVEVIKAAGADVVGLQEVNARDGADRGRRVAELLGWKYVEQGDRCGIATRFDVVKVGASKHGLRLKTPAGPEALVFNVHFEAAPYQPYLLCGIEYSPGVPFIKTAEEAVRSADQARGEEVRALLAAIEAERKAGDVVFVTGDFNEPSHLDWTAAAVAAGKCPVAVEYPATKALERAGFVDTFRAAKPDPVRWPGMTWTPTTRADDPKDRHDRIDFVMVAGAGRDAVVSSRVVGESKENAEVVVDPWPTDHRGVVAEVVVGGK